MGNQLAAALATRAAVCRRRRRRSHFRVRSRAKASRHRALAPGPDGDHSGPRRAGDARRSLVVARPRASRGQRTVADRGRRQRRPACDVRRSQGKFCRRRVDPQRRPARLRRRDRARARRRAPRRDVSFEQRHDGRARHALDAPSAARRAHVRDRVADLPAGRHRPPRGDGVHRLVRWSRRPPPLSRPRAEDRRGGGALVCERRRGTVSNGAPAPLSRRQPRLRSVLLGGRRVGHTGMARRILGRVLPGLASGAPAPRHHVALLRQPGADADRRAQPHAVRSAARRQRPRCVVASRANVRASL